MMDGEPRWYGGCPGNDRQQELRQSFGAKEASPSSDLWTGGLVCAFEFVRGHGFPSPANLSRNNSSQSKDLPVIDPRKPPIAKIGDVSSQGSDDGDEPRLPCKHGKASSESYWVPIGWKRITELVEMIEGDTAWDGQTGMGLMDDDQCCDITVADVATPYWQRPGGPTWWCHVTAGHPAVDAWLSSARWLHPAICVALRDEMRACSSVRR